MCRYVHPFLAKLNGSVFNVPPVFRPIEKHCGLTDFLNTIPIEFDKDGAKVKGQRLGKLLSKFGIENDLISRLLEQAKPVQVHISTREKDIWAATKSKYMSSCLCPGGENAWAVPLMVKDPNIAVALVRDKAGHIRSRAWLRYGQMKLESGWTDAAVIYRVYGDLSFTKQQLAKAASFFCTNTEGMNDQKGFVTFKTSSFVYYADNLGFQRWYDNGCYSNSYLSATFGIY